jgi:glycosyltransferase 2 family protein
MRILKLLPLAGGLLAVVMLVRHFGLESLASALTRITWWQFALVCAVSGVTLVIDTLGWRYTLAGARPPFLRLLAARCAGQAVNVVTALGGLGGEAIKAWLIRRDISYEASVPSLILAKTAEVVGQALLLVTGILVAWATGIVGWSLIGPMCYLLIIEVIGVSGFIVAQVTGGVGRVGRLLAWAGVGRGAHRIDGAVREFYRSHWRALLVSVGLHYVSWLVGTLEVLVILRSLHVIATAETAVVIEALGTGVRFATFFVPASLGTLEGAYAAAFTAFGWAASDGLAFSLVRRGRQAVWIGIGLAVLGAMGAWRTGARESSGENRELIEAKPVRAD